MSRDIIKELVDKEVDLEQCIKTIQKLSEDSAKIISGSNSNSSSISISMSQKFKTDADVFSEMIIDELKRENRDLKFALGGKYLVFVSSRSVKMRGSSAFSVCIYLRKVCSIFNF